MTSLIRILVGVLRSNRTFALVLFCAFSASSVRAADHEDAVSWAIEHRRDAFDRLMPRAESFGTDQPETVFSIRGEGFEDRFEFLLSVKKYEGKMPEATLVIPADEPLVVQLARARSDGSLSFDEILRRVRLNRRPLPATAAKRLYQRLMSINVPLRPQTGFFIHKDRLEVTAVAWSEMRFEFFDDGVPSSQLGQMRNAVWTALRSVGVTPSELAFDLETHEPRYLLVEAARKATSATQKVLLLAAYFWCETHSP